MTYIISNSRNQQIVTQIGNVSGKNNITAEVDAFNALLKIDTKQSNADFLIQFRELKRNHPFINDLCQRKGFLGSVGYAFRGDNYRAERYKAIINQLKTGIYNAQDNKKISYFCNATNFKKSVCGKVEEIKNGYLAKAYTSTESQIYKNDNIVFKELKHFNDNVGFNKPSKAMSTNIQTKDDTDMSIWNAFVKCYPEYSILALDNQKIQNVNIVNINGISVQVLKNKVLTLLGFTNEDVGGILLFQDNSLNKEVGKAIKKYAKKIVAGKVQIIQSYVLDFQRHLKEKDADEFGNRKLTYGAGEGKSKQTFLFSSNNVGFQVPDPNSAIKGAKGSFKRIINKNNNTVLFKQIEATTFRFSGNQVEQILIEHKISSIKGTIQISDDQYIAHNAGGMDLFDAVRYGKRFTPSMFENNLKDLKTLHREGYFHFDLKPENIMFDDKRNRLTIVDLDMFSSVDNFLFGGSGDYIDLNLYNYGYSKNNTPDNRKLLFCIRDEYAFALTLLKANGINWPPDKFTKMEMTKEVEIFIQTYVKKDHQDKFRRLVKNPYEYAQQAVNNQEVVTSQKAVNDQEKRVEHTYLADMFNQVI